MKDEFYDLKHEVIELHEIMIKSLSNSRILALVIESSFKPWKGKVWVYAWSYETYVDAMRTLWEWSVNDYIFVVVGLLKGHSHETLTTLMWKVFSHRKNS